MNEFDPIELHQPVIYKNQSAIELLASSGELSLEQLELCFENGAIWLETTGKPKRLHNTGMILKPGHKIHCYCNSTTLTDCPFEAELIADYTDFSLWNKPSGMLSQGSKWGDHWALYRWIEQNYWPKRQSFITHRLDRFTAGLIIVAHSESINKKFHQLFENRLIEKTYRAIVSGLMTENKSITLDTAIQGKQAKTRLKVLQSLSSNQQTLVELKPETGRKHQIRVHLAKNGHPVINDRQYGKPPFSGDLMLQACELDFFNPVNGEKIHTVLESNQLLSLS